ncbi:unnamed protein product [Cunninghamella echinulata]
MMIIFLTCAGLFCFWLEFISTLFCDQNKYYNVNAITKSSSMSIVSGYAVNWQNSDSEIAETINMYSGQYVTSMFPFFMELQRDITSTSKDPPYNDLTLQRCIYEPGYAKEADNWLTYKLNTDPGYDYQNGKLLHCPFPNLPGVTGAPCFFPPKKLLEKHGVKGEIVYDREVIKSKFNSLPTPKVYEKGYVVLDGQVLDVTSYLVSATNLVLVTSDMHSRAFARDRMFLPLDITTLLYLQLGQDITPFFDSRNLTESDFYRDCLKEMFFAGVTSDAKYEQCQKINPALWATMGCGLLYFFIKMNLANLSRIKFVQRLLFKSNPEFSMTGNSRIWPLTILMVPCYAESAETICATLNSLARTNYEDSRKLLLFVCDGVVQSAHDAKESYLCVLEALGCSTTNQTMIPHAYVSLGEHRRKINFAKVYSGFYETGSNRVPFMVVVKVGAPHESCIERAPGNRGKRDSLLLVLGFLERCMNLSNNRMTPLEYELFNQCYNVLGIDPRRFKYMLVTDADTQVQSDVVQKLVGRLERDRKMLAISGHIRPANPEQNFITMLQIFPLYMTFFTGLAYEACLGNVLTINGGLVMYKLWTENTPLPLENNNNNKNNNNQQQQMNKRHRLSKSQSTSRESIYNSKWPKVSDEIPSEDEDPFATLPRDATVPKQYMDDDQSSRPSLITGRESQLSLTPMPHSRPCCIHPTVLRSFAAQQAQTLHMQNVLLLGEDLYFGIVLLQSHPHHHLGFEPDAVGYSTVPTNYWALQALQSRNLRATFHNQIEMTRVARHISFSAWFLSITKIIDMIFSMPIIVYLYGIFIRCFKSTSLAYSIIVYSFTALFMLHVFYFLVRRQFKYVIWFFLYCVFSVALYAIWFPIVAVWCSDYAERWYDVWPTIHGWSWNGRLHGCVDDDYSRRIEQKYNKQNNNEDIHNNRNSNGDDINNNQSRVDYNYITSSNSNNNKNNVNNKNNKYDNTNTTEMKEIKHEDDQQEDTVVRMRFSEFENLEAQRAYDRAAEEAAELDAKFTGFTAFGQSQSLNNNNNALIIDDDTVTPSPPPLAQIKNGYTSLRGTTSGYRPVASIVDMYGSARNSQFVDNAEYVTASPTDSLVTNPFADTHDNPFDDGYAASRSDSTPASIYPMNEVISHHHNHHNHHHHHLPHHQKSSSSSSQQHSQDYKHHKPSHSQSSYFSNRSSRNQDYYPNTPSMFIPIDDNSNNSNSINNNNCSVIGSSDENHHHHQHGHYRSYSAESARRMTMDNRSILSQRSTANSWLSIDPETTLELREYRHREDEEGRSAAIHGRVGLKIPERSAAAMTAAAYRQRQHQEQQQQQQQNNNNNITRRRLYQQQSLSYNNSSIRHQRNTSDTSQHNPSNFVDLIQMEIRSYLSRADLDSTTRAQVKEHLLTVLGERTQLENLQEVINACIEETTLELLSQQSSLPPF